MLQNSSEVLNAGGGFGGFGGFGGGGIVEGLILGTLLRGGNGGGLFGGGDGGNGVQNATFALELNDSIDNKISSATASTQTVVNQGFDNINTRLTTDSILGAVTNVSNKICDLEAGQTAIQYTLGTIEKNQEWQTQILTNNMNANTDKIIQANAILEKDEIIRELEHRNRGHETNITVGTLNALQNNIGSLTGSIQQLVNASLTGSNVTG